MHRLFSALIALSLSTFGPASVLAQAQGNWTSVGPMASPREYNAQLPLPAGKVMSMGGDDGAGNVLASAEIYNPGSGQWTPTGAMKAARELFAAVVLKNGEILVVGGLGAGGTVLTSAELYDPGSGQWSPAGDLKTARYYHTATVLKDGRVVVAGGCTASACASTTATSEIYDPISNTWSTTGSLGLARYSHTAVLLGTGRVLVMGGDASGAASTRCELYNATKGKWVPAASTHTPRVLNGATLLQNGQVLVTGGASGRYPIGTAELYDPATNLWTYTGSLSTPTYGHTSTLLSDGTVLVAGGNGKSISCGRGCVGYIPTAAAELYNPATGGFSTTTSLPRALAYQSTTLTTSGRAVASGGLGYNAYCCQVVSDAEYYTPLTLTFSAYSLDFGLLQVGLTSPSQLVTVTNLSDHTSTFKSITSGGDYEQTNTCLPALSPGQQCVITVTFKPTAAGVRAGKVTLKDDDPGSPSQVIALTGTGETLSLGFAPGALAFGSVAVGSTSTQSATLTNDGSAPVAISGISISPVNKTYTQTNNCPATLAVQQSCSVTVTFAPPDVFTYTATVSVANDAGAPATLTATGTGVDGP